MDTEGGCTVECSTVGMIEIKPLLVGKIVLIVIEIETLLGVNIVLMGEGCSTVLGNDTVVGSSPIKVTYSTKRYNVHNCLP